ncbi:MAG: High molecular weight rubredoxin [Syntrophus sp. (in: bacteria)]|nr:High molecular weight rubredoxin [Syntrophus sp. (in: bacteria)]MBA4418570.1 High molecular weight rubredoxin [Syntrophus sp. (in: bacteria)]
MNIRAIQQICYGLYIISSRKGEKFNGQIANTVFQITSEPPTVAVSINKQNLTHEFIQESRVFSISILGKEAPMPFIGNFGFKSGRELDKFKEMNFKVGITGAPIVLDNAVGYLECEVISVTDVGTHTIFIGQVKESEMLSDAEPMSYAYYREIKGGKSPKTAPTYIAPEKEQEKTVAPEKTKAAGAAKYSCIVCGYVYDPDAGDPDSGIAPGTPFEDLPDTWVCPTCSAPKSEFEKI